jgi:hypothetical protein
MARHAVSKTSRTARRAALRAGLTLTAASAAIGMGAVVAQAAPVTAAHPAAAGEDSPLGGPTAIATGALTGSLTNALEPVGKLTINPLSGTGVDPLDNAVGTQVADFQPVSTAAVTGPLAHGASLSNLLGGG